MPDEHNPHILQHDTGQNISHTKQDETTEVFLNQETTHFNRIPDPSETATIQNVSEFSEESTNIPQSIAISDDSKIIQIPVHNITQTHINDHTSNGTTYNPNQDNTSTLSTSNTLTTQELQPQQTIQPNYDPPPPPSQYSPLTTPHNSPQQGSSITQVTNTVQFQTITPTTQPEEPTLANTLAQTTQTQSMQPALTINTLQSIPLPNYTASRHLSRPPLQFIPANPLSYGPISTNLNNTQPTITNNNQLKNLNLSSTSQQSNTSRRLQNTQFQIPKPPSTTIRTNPYTNPTYTQPVINSPHLQSNVSNIPIYNTNPSSTKPQPTVSQPTYIYSSTSISEPIKPFDG